MIVEMIAMDDKNNPKLENCNSELIKQILKKSSGLKNFKDLCRCFFLTIQENIVEMNLLKSTKSGENYNEDYALNEGELKMCFNHKDGHVSVYDILCINYTDNIYSFVFLFRPKKICCSKIFYDRKDVWLDKGFFVNGTDKIKNIEFKINGIGFVSFEFIIKNLKIYCVGVEKDKNLNSKYVVQNIVSKPKGKKCKKSKNKIETKEELNDSIEFS
jgi:hypothetical protein